MDTSHQDRQLRLVLDYLQDLGAWTDGKLKFVGGYLESKISKQQLENIYDYLEHQRKVIKVINKPSAAPEIENPDNIDIALLDSPIDYLYYEIELLPGFDSYATGMLQSVEQSLPLTLPLDTPPRFIANEDSLAIGGQTIAFDSKSLLGRILIHILKRPGIAVSQHVIEADYLNLDPALDIVDQHKFNNAIRAINTKVSRRLTTSIPLLKKSQDKIKLNPSIYKLRNEP